MLDTMARNRRSFLRAAGVAATLGVAGCLGDGGAPATTDPTSDTTGTTTTATTTTPTTTSGPPAARSLSLDARVLWQADADRPARVEATLANDGDATVVAGYGRWLLFTDNAGGLEWPEGISLAPVDSSGRATDLSRSDSGCWRAATDEERTVVSILEYRGLAPGETISQRYDVFTADGASACRPDGRYVFEDGVTMRSDDSEAVLTLVLDLDGGEVQIGAGTDARAVDPGPLESR